MKSKYRIYFNVIIDEPDNNSNDNFDIASEIFCELDDLMRDCIYNYNGDFTIIEEDED